MLWDIGDALELKLRGSTVLTMRVPETPPDLPLDCDTLGRGSRLRDEPAEKFPAQQWRRLDRRAYP